MSALDEAVDELNRKERELTTQDQVIRGLRSRVAELEGDEGWARRRLAELEAAALGVIQSGSVDPGERRVIVPVELFDGLRRLVPINRERPN